MLVPEDLMSMSSWAPMQTSGLMLHNRALDIALTRSWCLSSQWRLFLQGCAACHVVYNICCETAQELPNNAVTGPQHRHIGSALVTTLQLRKAHLLKLPRHSVK